MIHYFHYFLVKIHKVGNKIENMEHSFKKYFAIKTSKDMTKNIKPKESKHQPNQDEGDDNSFLKFG